MQLATAEAAVRLKSTGAPVSSIFGLSTLEILDDEPESHNFADRFYASNWNAGLDLFRSGSFQIADREPIVRPDLIGSFDIIGFSYYCAFGVRNGQLVPFPENISTSALGYSIWAEGLIHVLDRLHREIPRVPLLIAEYGIGTSDDEVRANYLREGLQIVKEALNREINIKGFFHWTAVDNYEWLHGFDLQFGIIDGNRHVKPSASVFHDEIRHLNR
jgi:beta-glucosidase